jgi:hypothetical protein
VKRYAAVLLAAMVVAAIGVRIARAPRTTDAPAGTPPPRPSVSLHLVVTPEERLEPAIAAVPKDHLVRLQVTNRRDRAVTLTLVGYQDRFAAASIAAHATWHGEFVADRPGEGFAWMLEGAPVGRLQVTGSHLIEGHR